ncbi:MAG: hypothetical protein DRJ03_07610 [Chloroflexi bacterium]|nr:MAG: hypothetical protein DRJ03_07610 [Chloroflexota bacterium]
MTEEQFVEQVKLAYAYGASVALQEAGANQAVAEDAGVKLASEKMAGGLAGAATRLEGLAGRAGDLAGRAGGSIKGTGSDILNQLKSLFAARSTAGPLAGASTPEALHAALSQNRNLGLGLGTAAGVGSGVGGALGLQALLGEDEK